MSIIGKTTYQFIPKGWGWEKIFWNDDKYCGKLLFIAVEKRVSWHYHLIKDETFYLQSGEMIVWYGHDDDINKASRVWLKQGVVFHVPVGLRHRMMGETDCYLFEFSTHHEDSDSIRLIKGD